MSNPKLQLGSDDTYHLQRIIGNDRLDITVGITTSQIALTMLDTGNVGIGVTNPTQSLDVNGITRIRSVLQLKDSTDTTSTRIFSHQDSSVTNGTSRFMFFGKALSAANTGLIQYDHVSDGSSLNNVGIGFFGGAQLFNVNANGNVGIGTPTPGCKLSLGSDLANTKLCLWDNGSIAYGFGIQNGQFRLHLDSSSARYSFLDDAVGTNELMTILGTGNIGIGVTSPNAQLDIRGSTNHRGNIRSIVEEITTNTTLNSTHSIIMVGTTGGNVTITLPVSHDGTAEPNFIGSEFKIIKKGAVNTVTIVRGGSDLIDGTSASVTLTGDRDRILLVNSGGANSIGEWHSF